jgi:hypothetical protein
MYRNEKQGRRTANTRRIIFGSIQKSGIKPKLYATNVKD